MLLQAREMDLAIHYSLRKGLPIAVLRNSHGDMTWLLFYPPFVGPPKGWNVVCTIRPKTRKS